jgi:hypothetical protein
MKKLLSKIGRFLVKQNEEAVKEEYYMPKLFGEGKTVEYEIDGLAKSFCKVTEWTSGEGYDISFDTEKQETKRIDLHTDEIEVFLACLNHFKYFGK